MDNKNRQFLSKGSFGTVYYDKFKKIVSKYIYIYDENSFYIENNIKEILFHCLITFNYFNNIPSSLPRMKSLVFKDNYCVINMPYYGRSFNEISFSELSSRHIFDLITSLNFLHQHSFSHGDLKPSNILVHNEQLYLIDFGSVCFKHSIKFDQFTQRCTIFYVSPEECKLQKFYITTDIWSLGCIIFEHITRKRFIEVLFRELKLDYEEFENLALNTKEFKTPYKILKLIFDQTKQTTIDNLIDKYIYYTSTENKYYNYNSLIKNCLQIKKENRSTAVELLKNNLFKDFNSFQVDLNTKTNKFNNIVFSINKDLDIFLNTIYNGIRYLKSIEKLDYKIEDKDIENLSKTLTCILLLNYSIKEDSVVTSNLKKFFKFMPYLLKLIESKDIF